MFSWLSELATFPRGPVCCTTVHALSPIRNSFGGTMEEQTMRDIRMWRRNVGRVSRL
jgi:hypothetical protein